MTQQLHEILERLEKAEGPDREIDAWLIFALDLEQRYIAGGKEPIPRDIKWDGVEFSLYDENGKHGFWGPHVVPEFTASLDAAVALVEKMLPEWWWRVNGGSPATKGRLRTACVAPIGTHDTINEIGMTAPLALLAAMAKALIAETEK